MWQVTDGTAGVFHISWSPSGQYLVVYPAVDHEDEGGVPAVPVIVDVTSGEAWSPGLEC